MSCRSTPERLHAARRAATLARLIGDGELPDRAETALAGWERKATIDGRERDGNYWEAAYHHIREASPARGVRRSTG